MAASLGKFSCNPMPMPARIIGSGWFLIRAKAARQFQLCPWRSSSSGRQRFSAASLGLQARIRPFPILIATGGSYIGYNQYCRYRDRQLIKTGIEVPPRMANATQVGRNPGVHLLHVGDLVIVPGWGQFMLMLYGHYKVILVGLRCLLTSKEYPPPM